MKTKKHPTLIEELNVLVIGNNPGELGRVFDGLKSIPGKKVIAEIAFDLATIVDRLTKFTPNFILIDDNIGKIALKDSVNALLRFRKTRSTPITVLKNSNYHEAISVGVLNFILKDQLTGDSLYKAMKNSLKFQQTQLYLRQAYRKRKGQLSRLVGIH